MVEITNEWELATESGFTGERRVYTWRDRIKELHGLGFILLKEGPKGPYQFVLIINPYHVISDLHRAGKVSETRWVALNERAKEIGARDLVKHGEKVAIKEKVAKLKELATMKS
ncbi:MAG: hypothetical protein Q7U82_00710 [Gammaproteobacteria bacterium]|nr:hypothetical protein [Gammaproteobacteria bacterium]